MQPTALVPLRIRDRVLWFQNNPRCVVLALVDPDNYVKQEAPEQEDPAVEDEQKDPAIEDLQWFLQEFKKDIQSLLDGAPAGEQSEPEEPVEEAEEPEQLVEVPEEPAEAAEPQAKKRGGLPRTDTPKDIEALVQETLKDLRARDECLSAGWSAARNSFRAARRSDKAKKEFFVKDLKRKRQDSEITTGADPVQTLFAKAKASAIVFLAEAPADTAAVPLADE